MIIGSLEKQEAGRLQSGSERLRDVVVEIALRIYHQNFFKKFLHLLPHQNAAIA